MSIRMMPRALAAAVRDLAHGLTGPPWNHHDPDETLWWLVPSKEWSGYSYGKLVFSTERAPAGEIFAGLNVEKGFRTTAVQAHPRTPRVQALRRGWTWHLVVDGEGPAHLEEVLGDVSIGNLQPGDTVFFANTYMPGLSHDGIYIGNGQFIHASDERTGVTISSINTAYWQGHYVGATRLWD